jgi:two-component system response regulator RegA
LRNGSWCKALRAVGLTAHAGRLSGNGHLETPTRDEKDGRPLKSWALREDGGAPYTEGMESRPKVLVIDDDPDVLKAAAIALASVAEVATALTPDELEARAGEIDVVLLDMNFAYGERSGREGFDALARLNAADPALAVVLMTTYGGVALAVEALKRGAADFVLKPWRNEALAAAVLAGAARTAKARKAAQVKSLDALEEEAIRDALAKFGGNVSQAAAALGLTRPALYRRMERYGI